MISAFWRAFLLSVVVHVIAMPTEAQQSLDVDILLKGGRIYDGSGGPAIEGDVAIQGDRIVAVGQAAVRHAAMTFDCSGLVIAPGFIDLHTHCDGPIVSPKTRANVNYLMQGCTTVVTGNCGGGPVDVAEYLDKIDSAGTGTNVIHLLPQGSLRSRVIGSEQRDATSDELKQMKELAEKAMRDGAWGVSTGLIYVPSSYADTDELVEIAKVVAAHHGIYASHIRNEDMKLLEAIDEALTIGRRAGLPVHISHFKSSGRDAWGIVRKAAKRIDAAREQGQKVTADQYPYIASSTSLDAMLIPTWARAGGRKKLIERLNDPEDGPRIRKAMKANLDKRNGGQSILIANCKKHPDWIGRRVSQIAESEQKTPLEISLQIAREGGASAVNFSMNEDDVRHIMRVPWIATGSDGSCHIPDATKPHPRSYGTFARKIGYYAIRENVLTLSQAIRSASGLPADILNLTDRGYLKPGSFADVAVFDPDAFIDQATFEVPHQYCAGIRYVLVNGVPAVFDGIPTGALAGHALKHPEPKPASSQ